MEVPTASPVTEEHDREERKRDVPMVRIVAASRTRTQQTNVSRAPAPIGQRIRVAATPHTYCALRKDVCVLQGYTVTRTAPSISRTTSRHSGFVS